MIFEIGNIVMTKRIAEDMKNNYQFSHEVQIALQKYKYQDWGNTEESDKKLNDEAVKCKNDRILAVYQTSKGKIWIITEYDRSITTILYPDEY